MFRAGTLSRLKRPSLFRSCRREASPKAQGFSEDASHHARKHKTPQRGRRTVSIDRFPKINGSGIPGSLPFHEKYVAHPQKKFSDRPLFKRGRRVAGREPCKKHWAQAGALQETLGAGGALQGTPGCRAEALQETLGAGGALQETLGAGGALQGTPGCRAEALQGASGFYS